MTDNYEKAFAYLEQYANDGNEENYKIVEDSSKYENGLLLIVYSDEEYEYEKYHVCIDIDDF